jgi:hypothetical protein
MELFLRVDDYTDATPEMRRVLEWLLGNGYKVHIAAIPGLLEPSGARFLETILNAHPGRVEVGQHGYVHACRRLGPRRFEVGPGMPRREQSRIINLGREALRERLVAPSVPVFTPPFNGYDDNTVLALIDNGFEVLSAEVRSQQESSIRTPLRQISINVDVCSKYFPEPALGQVDEIGEMVRIASSRDGYIGIMLHPDLVALTDAWLRELFTAVSAVDRWRSVLLSQVDASVKFASRPQVSS